MPTSVQDARWPGNTSGSELSVRQSTSLISYSREEQRHPVNDAPLSWVKGFCRWWRCHRALKRTFEQEPIFWREMEVWVTCSSWECCNSGVSILSEVQTTISCHLQDIIVHHRLASITLLIRRFDPDCARWDVSLGGDGETSATPLEFHSPIRSAARVPRVTTTTLLCPSDCPFCTEAHTHTQRGVDRPLVSVNNLQSW